MLPSTFCHLKGITPVSEQALWARGILSWTDCERCPELPFTDRKNRSVLKQLEESRGAFENGNFAHFLARLPTAERPRVLPHCRDRIGYLDIETTGLDQASHITTIALYDGREVHTFVRGRNLPDFAEHVGRYSLLVTYNGARFDLPFLRREFGIPLDQAHLDLCPVLRATGYRGGLKSCERQLGIRRQIPEDIDGFEAVRLWYAHRSGDRQALDKLLAYNAQDVLSLEILLALAYNRSMAACPVPCTVEPPTQPRLHWPGR